MTKPEALRILAVLAAYFHEELPDETGILWATELRAFQQGDALLAAQLAGKVLKWMPSLAEFIELITDERNARLIRQGIDRPVLKSAGTADEPSLSMTEYLAESVWHAPKYHRAGQRHDREMEMWDDHLRSVQQTFPSTVAAIWAKAEETELSLEEAGMRLQKRDYHSDERITAASVVVVQRCKDLGLPRPIVREEAALL